ncbi:MAG: DUF2934 domain-containing protein [Chthoniobacterales bacterium]
MTTTHIPTAEEHNQIAALAHQIYESTGHPQGCADDHWKQAEEILEKRKEHACVQGHKEQQYFSDEVLSE